MRTQFKKLGRESSKYRCLLGHAVHTEFKSVRKQYDKAIKYNKHHHWRDWLEKATNPDLWTANKYISASASDEGKTRILPLRQLQGNVKVTASTDSSKSKLLAQAFFPSCLPASTLHTEEIEYPEPICKTHKISREQIRRQLKCLRPYKAPGPDNIPNIVLSQCVEAITDRLFYIYSAILE